jgi:hypothetical protein
LLLKNKLKTNWWFEFGARWWYVVTEVLGEEESRQPRREGRRERERPKKEAERECQRTSLTGITRERRRERQSGREKERRRERGWHHLSPMDQVHLHPIVCIHVPW